MNSDNSVHIDFNSTGGDVFAKLIMNSESGEDSSFIDEKQISSELQKAGFSDVKISNSTLQNVQLSFTDKNQSSYLFSSGILTTKNGKLGVNLSAQNLKTFYDSADEQIVSVLDLFLAPVFNDEMMSEDEYLQTVAAFYGEKMANELKDSVILLTLVNADGSKKEQKIPYVKFFCGE